MRHKELGLASTPRWVIPTALVACCCLMFVYIYSAPRLFDVWLSRGIPTPTIPSYPAAQQRQVRQDSRAGVRYRRDTFVTADTPTEVKAYLARTLGPSGARWLPATSLGAAQDTPSGPQVWYYDSDYCPFTSVQVAFPQVAIGATQVEITTTRATCFDRFPYIELPSRP